MKRRDFLRSMLVSAIGVGAFFLETPLGPVLRLARAAEGKTLVVVFQRGGCDGLNTIVPYGDPEYYNLRTTIGIAAPDLSVSDSAIDLDGFFGLHPALAPFKPIFDAGSLAILPTVHYDGASRSHFDGQRFIESAKVSKSLDGWINRHLVSLPQVGQLRSVGFGSNLPHALKGEKAVPLFNDIAGFDLDMPEDDKDKLLADVSSIYNQSPDASKAYRTLVYDHGKVLIDALLVMSDIDVSTYTPSNGAVYPSSTFGRQLAQIAQLIKAGVGLEVAALSIGGWDTHSNQGGGESNGLQARRFRDFSEGIAAFYTDLGGMMDDVLVLTMTEFGRTAKENGSRGTDHGHAATWFAMGQMVNGGIHFGTGQTWPGLAQANLLNGRYLNHTVDFRDVFGDVLTGHLGNASLDTVLPEHSYSPVGIV